MADISDRLEALVQTIQNLSAFGASFIYDTGKLLESLGYTLQENDSWLLGFCLQKVEQTIKNECNVSEIPGGLMKVASRMVIGEFLFAKKGSGQLQGFSLNLDAAVKQIALGDTSYSFAVGDACKTPEQRLDVLILYLLQADKGEFVRYRRLSW